MKDVAQFYPSGEEDIPFWLVFKIADASVSEQKTEFESLRV